MDAMGDFNANIIPSLTKVLNSKASASKNKAEVIHIYQNIKSLVNGLKQKVKTTPSYPPKECIQNLKTISDTLEQFHSTAQGKGLIKKTGWLSFIKPQDACNMLYNEIQADIKAEIKRLKAPNTKNEKILDNGRKGLDEDKRQKLNTQIKEASPSYGKNLDEDKKTLQALCDEYGFKTLVFAFIDSKVWSDHLLDSLNTLDQKCSFFNHCFLIRKSDYDTIAIKSASNFKIVTPNEILKGYILAQESKKRLGAIPNDEQTLMQCKNLLKFTLTHGPFNIDVNQDTLKQWVDLRNIAKTLSYEHFELDKIGSQHAKVNDKLEAFFFHLPHNTVVALIKNSDSLDIEHIKAEGDVKLNAWLEKHK